MDGKRKRILAKAAVILGVVPVLLWAYEYGPDPGWCGVPTENGGQTCAHSGCHDGTTNNPANKGSVVVNFLNGKTYSPGVAQHLSVTISDPAGTQLAWGFELTARMSASPSTMAGTFASDDANTQLMCSTPNFGALLPVTYNPSGPQTCPSGEILQYIEHSLAGYHNTMGQGSGTYQFEWTPPASASGNITIYLAGNAGVGGQPTQHGDHIYATNYVLTSSIFGNGKPPAVSAGGVVSAGDFGLGVLGGFPAATAGSWIEIYGTNLAPDMRGWADSDFNGNTAPTSLDGVKVTINNQPAAVEFISSLHVNAQVPSGVGTGPATLILSNGNGASPAYTLTLNATQPGLLAPPSFTVGGKQYVVAQFQDGAYVLPSSANLGVTSRPAKPGDTITIYGVGFGPAQTPSNDAIPFGQKVTSLNQLTNSMQMSFGGTAVTPSYAGLSPGFVGLYQFNVTVPAIANSDTVPLTFTLGGAKGTQTMFIAVHN